MTILRKSLLLTTACCAGLALAVPSAQAQKDAGALSQPKGGWAVTKIDASTTQGGAYCTLARQFENGVIFSIGRNKAEEYSVAIDFQEAKLTADKPYDITLKAGNQTRQMQMLPVSPRALVIRLGWDDSFFAAMEKSQSFSATLDKTTYALSLPEYTKGKEDLAKCMDTLKSAGAGAGGTDVLAAESGIGGEGFAATKTAQAEGSTSVAPPAKKDPAKRPEKTSITELNTPEVMGLASNDKAAYVAPTRSLDVSSLEQENEKLRRQLTEQRQSYESRMAQGNQGNKVAELEEKLRLAEQRGGSAPVSLAAPTVAPVPAPVPVIKEVVKADPAQAQKIAELEKKIADLNKDIAAKAAAPAKVAPAVVAQPDPAQTKKITELEQKVASLSKELSSKNDLTMKAAPTPLPNPEQAKRITELQEQVGTLRTQLADAKKVPVPAPVPTPVVAAPAVSKPQDAAKIAELEQARQAYETRIASLETQLSGMQQQEPVVAKKSLRPVPSAVPADNQSQGQIASLQGELHSKNAQIRSSQQRLASYERELSQLRQQVGQLQRSGGKAPAIPAGSAERLKDENNTLRAQLAQQKEQFERRLASQEQMRQAEPKQVAQASQITPTPRNPSSSASVAPVAVAAGGSDLKNILSRAGISANAESKGDGASESYRWKSGVMDGRAQAYAGKGNALDVSQMYANNQRNACTGDFASVPGPAKDGRVSMDIACVDNSGARAQSLLFAEEGGQVMAFIIESSAEEMDQAMDARDSLGKQL